MAMLTKFNDKKVKWLVTTYDGYEYFWTDAEYEFFKQATSNPNMKILHFKDGTLAIADVRRVEPYNPPQTFEERNGLSDELLDDLKLS